MSKRAVIYGRVSGDDRDNEGRNLGGQIEMGRRYATARDYQIVAEMPEDERGASGAEIDLPKLKQIRAMAQAGEIDVLIVREIDRLSRNLAKQLIVDAEFKKAGVEIEYVLGEYPDTPEGNFMKHVRASVAEFEREKIRERMERGRDLKIKAGSVMVYRRPPYGYSLQTDANGKYTLKVNEAEAQIIRLMYYWYTRGDESGRPMSLHAIAGRLTKMGVPTTAELRPGYVGFGRTMPPGYWAPAVVSRMLGNEAYCGIWHWGKTKNGRKVYDESAMIAVEIPPIIDRATWELARDRQAANRHDQWYEPKHEYLLARRLTCRCGFSLAAWPQAGHGKTYLYYRCSASRAQGRRVSKPCNEKVYRAGVIDGEVWKWIEGFFQNPGTLKAALLEAQAAAESANAPALAELQTIDDLLADAEAQAQRIKDGFQSGIYTKEDTIDRQQRINDTLRTLRAQREKSAARFAKDIITDERISRILELFDGLADKVKLGTRNFEIRRALIEELDVTAVVWREGKEVHISASCILGKDEFTNNGRYNCQASEVGKPITLVKTITLAEQLFKRAGVPVSD